MVKMGQNGVIIGQNGEQAVAELGHTWIPSCQLGQCSDHVEPDRWYWLLRETS